MLHLIDGPGEIYRALFKQGPPLVSDSGEPTRGTYFFVRMLLKLVRELKPTHLAMAMDDRRENLQRRKWFPAYKTGRKTEFPEEFHIQRQRINQIIGFLGIPVFRSAGWEADDVIATTAYEWPGAGSKEVLVVSRDKDMSQLVCDRVRLYDAHEDQEAGRDEVRRRWGVEPADFPLFQALAGDAADGIPGVKGVGPKKAAELVALCGGDLGVLYENLEDLSPALQRNIREADVELMLRLARLYDNVPLEPAFENGLAARFEGLKLDGEARALFRHLGFRRWSQ